MYAITVESCKSEWSGEPDGRARVILWNVNLVESGPRAGTYRGPVVDVAEDSNATIAILHILTMHCLNDVAILTEENQLDYADELSVTEACEAYFGSRNKALKF